ERSHHGPAHRCRRVLRAGARRDEGPRRRAAAGGARRPRAQGGRGRARRPEEDRQAARAAPGARRPAPRRGDGGGTGARAEAVVRPAGLCQERDVVCFFRSGHVDKTRYTVLGFHDQAALDDAGGLWPTSYAVAELTPQSEEEITEVVQRAAG